MKYFPYWKLSVIIICLAFCQADLLAQDGEIVHLSPEIGTELDAAENVYYNIFPDISGFKNAQFYEQPDRSYIAKIVFVKYSNQRTTKRRFTFRQFFDLQNSVKGFPELTESERSKIKSDFTYLNTVDVMNNIPGNQYVIIKHRDGKKIKGTFIKFDEKYLHVQTPLEVLRIPLWQMNNIAYKTSIIDRSSWKKYFLLFSASLGVGAMEVWNNHRDPVIDKIWYNRVMGLMLGIIFSNELQEASEILLTPNREFALTPEDQKTIELTLLKKFKVLD